MRSSNEPPDEANPSTPAALGLLLPMGQGKPPQHSNSSDKPKLESIATTEFIVQETGKMLLLLGLEMSAERRLILGKALSERRWSPRRFSLMCRFITEDPEISREVLRAGTLIPAHFTAADREMPAPRQPNSPQVRRAIAEFEAIQARQEFTKTVVQQKLLDREVQDRCLAEGTPHHQLDPTSPHYLKFWEEYYSRPYVQDAQERAREYLKR